MSIFAIFLTGIGLSMDAFAVSICKGLSMKKINWTYAIVIALFFGVFQAVMPIIGWALGSTFASLIEPIDHWIAFILLLLVGSNMLVEAIRGDDEESASDEPLKIDIKELFVLAVATSIDALAVGISFALLAVNILQAAIIIGVTTFVLSLVGVGIGNIFGSRFSKPSTIAGGIILILIGVKILLEHLGIL
jgi:putative Mn2+ efflux pump MntP